MTRDPSRQLNKQNQHRNVTVSSAPREIDYPLAVKMINRLPSIVLRPTFLFRLYQRLKGTKPPCQPPTELPYAAVLKTQGQIVDAVEEVERCNLFKNLPLCKNWDALAALSIVLHHTDKNVRILDAGAEIYSPLLPWLHSYGYRELIGVNLCFKKSVRRGRILYQPRDITGLDFPNDYFDAIACLSVIEHNVPLDGYFKEMARVLKPGGVLITSTDYWEKGLDTKGEKAYGGPINIFNGKNIVEALEIAGKHNLDSIQEVDLSCEDAPVSWTGLNFTFIYFSLRKRI